LDQYGKIIEVTRRSEAIMAYPESYIKYLCHFHGTRDYFECHEILEEYWKSKNQQEIIWVGLIKIAVALYHHRRGNFNGAEKMMKNALKIVTDEKISIQKLGLEALELENILKKRLQEIQNKEKYYSLNLPITDDTLLQKCQNICQTLNVKWGDSSNENDPYLLHKHKLRDRSDVINERLQQLQFKKQKGQ
jgi:uncharacterized protein